MEQRHINNMMLCMATSGFPLEYRPRTKYLLSDDPHEIASANSPASLSMQAGDLHGDLYGHRSRVSFKHRSYVIGFIFRGLFHEMLNKTCPNRIQPRISDKNFKIGNPNFAILLYMVRSHGRSCDRMH